MKICPRPDLCRGNVCPEAGKTFAVGITGIKRRCSCHLLIPKTQQRTRAEALHGPGRLKHRDDSTALNSEGFHMNEFSLSPLIQHAQVDYCNAHHNTFLLLHPHSKLQDIILSHSAAAKQLGWRLHFPTMHHSPPPHHPVPAPATF